MSYTNLIGKLMYQYTHKMLPDLFQDYFSDSTSSHSYTFLILLLVTHTLRDMHPKPLFIPRNTTTRTQQSFKYIGAKIWNDIPQVIRQYSYPKFKSLLNFY